MPHRLAEPSARRRVPKTRTLSQLAVATFVPSGLKATATTMLLCLIGSPSGRPLAASQRRAVLSPLPVASQPPFTTQLAVATFVPSGLKATAKYRAGMPSSARRAVGPSSRPKDGLSCPGLPLRPLYRPG